MTYTKESIEALAITVMNLYDTLTDGLSEEFVSDIVDNNICLTAEQARGFGLTDIADDIESCVVENEGVC